MCQLLDAGLSVEGVRVGKSALTILGRHGEGSSEPKRVIPSFQEKPLSFSHRVTVPQTDTGGLVENTKALERTQEKELGKLIP